LILACSAWQFCHKGQVSDTRVNLSIDVTLDMIKVGYTLRTAVSAAFADDLQKHLLNRIDRPTGRRRINRSYYSNHQEGAL
jgi:hypothetical protein